MPFPSPRERAAVARNLVRSRASSLATIGLDLGDRVAISGRRRSGPGIASGPARARSMDAPARATVRAISGTSRSTSVSSSGESRIRSRRLVSCAETPRRARSKTSRFALSPVWRYPCVELTTSATSGLQRLQLLYRHRRFRARIGETFDRIRGDRDRSTANRPRTARPGRAENTWAGAVEYEDAWWEASPAGQVARLEAYTNSSSLRVLWPPACDGVPVEKIASIVQGPFRRDAELGLRRPNVEPSPCFANLHAHGKGSGSSSPYGPAMPLARAIASTRGPGSCGAPGAPQPQPAGVGSLRPWRSEVGSCVRMRRMHVARRRCVRRSGTARRSSVERATAGSGRGSRRPCAHRCAR